MSMAAKYQPNVIDDKTKEPRDNPMQERYAYWLAQAREANARAAPYFTPTLKAVMLGGSVAGIPDAQKNKVDPRQRMVEMYLGMRRRSEITTKVIEGPKTAKAVIEEVVEAEVVEDDGDGVLS
jgi:hypothetical protein